MNHFKSMTFFAPLVLMAWALTGCGSSQESAVPAAGDAHAGEENAQHQEGRFARLTVEQVRAAKIGLRLVGSAPIDEILPLYGVIAPNAERVREVAARFPGVIREVYKKVGDSIRQGEALAVVESNESLQSYAVNSPLTGVVTMRNANPGEQSGDKMLFTIADLSSVWVELSLFPRDVPQVRLGQKVRIRGAEGGLEAQGAVIYLAPLSSSHNQTLSARVLLDNHDRKWAPGLYVSADVVLSERQAALAIRSEAVQFLDGQSVVFVQGAAGFEPRPVQLGHNDGATTEILQGIRVGEVYAAENSFILKSELGKNTAEHGH